MRSRLLFTCSCMHGASARNGVDGARARPARPIATGGLQGEQDRHVVRNVRTLACGPRCWRGHRPALMSIISAQRLVAFVYLFVITDPCGLRMCGSASFHAVS